MELFLSEASNEDLLAYEDKLMDAQASLYLKLQKTPVCYIKSREIIQGRIDTLEDKLANVGVLLDSKVGVR